MKSKNYYKKREDLKHEKRKMQKQDFKNTKSRKKYIEGIKCSFRSLKRSEKHVIKMETINKVWGYDDEQFDPDGDKLVD